MTDFPKLWQVQTASGTQKLVLVAIGFFSRRDGVCYARRTTIAKATCLHLKSVDNAIAELSKAGFLSLEKNYDAGKGQRPARIMLTLDHREDWELDPSYAPHGPTGGDDPLMTDHGGEHNPRRAGQGTRAERVTPPAQDGSHIDTLTTRLIDRKVDGPNGPAPSLFKDMIQQATKLWNELAERTGLPKAIRLSEARKSHIGERLEHHGLEGWQIALSQVEGSRFLVGLAPKRAASGAPFRCTIDWLCNASNFLKVIEGNYAQDAPRMQDPDKIAAAMQDRLKASPSARARWASMWDQDAASWPDDLGPPPGEQGCVVPLAEAIAVSRRLRVRLGVDMEGKPLAPSAAPPGAQPAPPSDDASMLV